VNKFTTKNVYFIKTGNVPELERFKVQVNKLLNIMKRSSLQGRVRKFSTKKLSSVSGFGWDGSP
jgi:hypothetical protein